MKYSILSGMSVALIISAALADAQEVHEVAGAAKCSTWLDWRHRAETDSEFSARRLMAATWMQGYVSGVSYAFEVTRKITLHFPQIVRDSASLSSWLDEFCQAHPDKSFDSAGQWLVNDVWFSSGTSAIESIVQEGIGEASQAKTAVSEAYLLNGGISAVSSLAARWAFRPTEYVNNIGISPINGTITITYSARALEISGATIIFTPQVKVGNAYKPLNAIAADQADGVVWACSSSTNLSTLKSGMVVGAQGTLKAAYAPSICR